MTTQFTFAAETADCTEVEVTYSVTPFVAATYWQPAEGGEVEIISVTRNGAEVTLTDPEEDDVFKQAQDRAEADLTDARDDEADYRYEEYRDRMLERD